MSRIRLTARQKKAETALSQQLERFVDSHTLATVIDNLAEVCRDKAEHLRSNWQDEQAAKSWERDGIKLDRLNIEN
jgi:hypothetical protein